MRDEIVVLTSVIDRRAHRVTDTELTASHALYSGRFQALCGHLIAPAPMVEPDGSRCEQCAARDDSVRPEPSRSARGRRRSLVTARTFRTA